MSAASLKPGHLIGRCSTCQQRLDQISEDRIVRKYFEAVKRDGSIPINITKSSETERTESGVLIETDKDHEEDLEAITSSCSGRFLASVGRDRLMVAQDPQHRELLFGIDTHFGTLADVAFSPDEKYVATVAASGSIKKLSIFW